ncbi:glycosyltransferase family 2 protein [Sphingomonas bacterium]|uniref:glycosyltransferase family 2 protein n=1 Tax=Sphingomonas bacterium TaxID=1895847 RepID=UPI00260E67BA|nr:glycosyltransferase family 2 protein [Sphingomonas bacterium]MDB5678958.1 glycosyltransferase family 2 protein [Sphingomonas bacterium]
MYLDLDSLNTDTGRIAPRAAPEWTVLIPFFNERDYLRATIASIAAQSVPLRLILVDNGSSDGSAAIAVAACRSHGIDYLLLTETAPGKVAALRTGLGWVRTRWVATCDADTLYPPHYLAAAGAILSQPACVVAGSYFIAPDASEADREAKARGFLASARLLPRQSHTGGAGQAFCAATLRTAGGFDADRWNYVLEDHEIIHRVMRHGAMGYSRDLWCRPSPRDRDRESIRWTLFERLVYSVAAPWMGDWFFYSFLAARLRGRQLSSHRIRERQYQLIESPALAPSHPVL